MSATSEHRPPADDLTRSALGRAARRSGPACLDAEALAAYYERSLDANAKARADAHVAECLDCQKALVALARSEPEPVASVAGGRLWFPWRLAWAAPVLVAGLAVAVWYLQPPGGEPRQEAAVASRAMAERKATSAKTEGAPAEEAETAEPAATRPRAADEPAPGAGAAPPPLEARAASEKTEEKSAARRVVTGLATSLNQAAADATTTLVAAPGGRIVWRLSPGAIARSDDGGATWRTPATVDGEPLAGAAPSVTVCWAVGRSGAVWRTVDGARWEQLAAPVDAELVAVESTGADQAIVTADDGRRWETVDGGRTWFDRGDGGIAR